MTLMQTSLSVVTRFCSSNSWNERPHASCRSSDGIICPLPGGDGRNSLALGIDEAQTYRRDHPLANIICREWTENQEMSGSILSMGLAIFSELPET